MSDDGTAAKLLAADIHQLGTQLLNTIRISGHGENVAAIAGALGTLTGCFARQTTDPEAFILGIITVARDVVSGQLLDD